MYFKRPRTLTTVFAALAMLLVTVIPMPSAALTARAVSRTRNAAPADIRKTFVFQVGIDNYTAPGIPKLDGCVKDVLEMKKLLIRKFNVPAGHFLTLTDGQATHEAIIAGFRKQLIDNAKSHPDATVIFQYSGHGSRVKDRTGNKADGLSSTLVPVNSRDLKGSYFDIVDDEIRELFEELSQYTSNITFIIDACHSGNPTRGGGATRGIPEDTRTQPAVKTKPPSIRGGPPIRGEEIAGILPRDQRYVSIAATLPHELANETKQGNNGALTFHLLKALDKAKPETTYRELMMQVANSVTAEFPSQHPQSEGDIGRPVFGGSANREDPFIEIRDLKDDMMTIRAGSAQGIAPGTIVAVYAADAQRLVGSEKKLTQGTVMVVEPFASTVKLNATSGVTIQAKVVVISPDFGSITTRVAFAREPATRGASQMAALTTELKKLLARSTSVKLAGEVNLETPSVRGIDWDVVVKPVKFSNWFHETGQARPPSGTATPRPADRQVSCIVGPDGTRPLFDFFVELDDPAAADRMADALEHLANQRSLRAINNETSQLNGAIKINVIRVHAQLVGENLGPIEKEEVINPLRDAHGYSFDQGELLRLEIENQSARDLYITVFDISNDGSIQIFLPPPGGAIAIPKGGRVKPNSLIFRLTGPPGYETYKIIASTDRTGYDQFGFLAQGAIRSASRGVPMKMATLPDWTTAQVDFLISDKVK